jgi:hypothetical protein
MRLPILPAAAFALAVSASPSAWPSSPDRKALLVKASQNDLSLPVDRFDQDPTVGLRALDAAGCTTEAAVLVERYLIGYQSNLRSLKWHQAQLLAMTGKKREAIAAAREAINPAESVQHPAFKWNAYVLATIAFLEGNADELKRQAQALQSAVTVDPMNQVNLNIVLNLQRCMGKPYRLAYGCPA